jgi:ribosomal protein L2
MSSIIKFFVLKLKNKLYIGKKSFGGRNFKGRVCIIGRGGGLKRKYLFIDFFRRLNNFCYLLKILKDVNRSTFVGFVLYLNGLVSVIGLVNNFFLGNLYFSGIPYANINYLKRNEFFSLGSAVPLKYLNVFTIVNNLELRPNYGSKLIRSAGIFV